jgi:hypothetical protein
MEKQYYTYLWLREKDFTPYYVGKGHGNRAFIGHGHNVKCPKNLERIVVLHTESEQAAFILEKHLIAYYGRRDLGTGRLRNLTPGGENPPINRWNKGTKGVSKPNSGSFKKGQVSWCKGTKGVMVAWNKGVKGAQKAWNKGVKSSPEETQRLRDLAAARVGKKLTEEHKKKISSALIGKSTWKSAAANTGSKRSEETKRKMSEAQKGNTYTLGRKQSEEEIRKRIESRKRNKQLKETVEAVGRK